MSSLIKMSWRLLKLSIQTKYLWTVPEIVWHSNRTELVGLYSSWLSSWALERIQYRRKNLCLFISLFIPLICIENLISARPRKLLLLWDTIILPVVLNRDLWQGQIIQFLCDYHFLSLFFFGSLQLARCITICLLHKNPCRLSNFFNITNQ